MIWNQPWFGPWFGNWYGPTSTEPVHTIVTLRGVLESEDIAFANIEEIRLLSGILEEE